MMNKASASANLHATDAAHAVVGHYSGSLRIYGDHLSSSGFTVFLPEGVDAAPIADAFNKAMEAYKSLRVAA